MKFEYGDVTELTENAIAESMYAMCDENGNHILLFDAIVDHKKNDKAMTRIEKKFVDSRGKQQYKRSTKGWEVCIVASLWSHSPCGQRSEERHPRSESFSQVVDPFFHLTQISQPFVERL